ncbi:hypothetical protein AB0D46_28330 [Streptomyces sp. NPDC048383]|uniref:hypothetical protein n=1 Tax=Streptomyces sp. NPDC048383 TaxID=3155386 RepID=UPI003419DC78
MMLGAAVFAAATLSLTVSSASAAPMADPVPAPSVRACGEVRLTGSLPAPPAGMAVRQQVTIGADCKPVFGEARLVPAPQDGAAQKAAGSRPAAAAGDAPATERRLRSWNEMYDCCNIRMTGLYTTSRWTPGDGRISTASTAVTQGWNREPWNAGWSLKSAVHNTDCTTDCGASRTEAHADFTYKGIFDFSGNTYANAHHSYVDLNADGTANCRFDVQLRNTFIGWNWQRGCS